MIVYLSLLVAILGAFIFVISTNNAKAAELGRICFAMGLLVFLLRMGAETFTFFKHGVS